MALVRYLNLPAHMCSREVSAPNPTIVRYGGEQFVIIGFFFAERHDGIPNGHEPRRILHYVLRTFDGDSSNGLPLEVHG